MGTVLIFHCYQEDEVSKYAHLVTDPSTMGIGKWVMAPVPKRRDTSALRSKMALSTVLPKSEVFKLSMRSFHFQRWGLTVPLKCEVQVVHENFSFRGKGRAVNCPRQKVSECVICSQSMSDTAQYDPPFCFSGLVRP